MRVSVSRIAILLLSCTAVAGCAHDIGGGAARASTGVTDCGKVTNAATSAENVFKGCFDEHFASCTPARITIGREVQPLKGVFVLYEIQGSAGADCNVRWRYLKLPYNPSWENADVVCPYAAGPDFQAALTATGDFRGCTGPLLKLIGDAPSQGTSPSATSKGGSSTASSAGPSSSGSSSGGSSSGSITVP
jgi:hypothetical protein